MTHARFFKPFAAVMITTALCFATGKLGLLLAIPPGYATAVWLPSGIALGAIMLWGRPMTLGVWLGSFLVNLDVAFHRDPHFTAHPARAALIAAGIGLGAALQTHVGAALVRRTVGIPSTLVETRDIFRFLLLGGPIGCLVNASLAVSWLVSMGVMTGADAPMNWLTWWAGDTIGVFIMTPLMLVAFAHPRALWRARLLPVGGALVFGTCVGAGLFTWAKLAEQASHWQMWTLLVGVFSLTGLLGAFALVLTGHTHVIKAQVRERTARLAELNQSLEAEVRDRLKAQEETQTLNRELEKRVAERTRQLEIASGEADAANRAKSAFLANMSHEVRTPMNGILGLAEILDASTLSEEQRLWVGTLKKSGHALMRLLNDVLDLSKIEAGHLNLEKAPFDLRQEADEVLKLMGAKASQKQVELRLQIDPGVPAHLCGDALRLRQILLNLVGNAVKFTSHGHVAISARLDDPPAAMPPNQRLLHLTVTDSGVGIPAGQLTRIFEPFAQSDSAIARIYGGTGLGLSISARLAKAMDGRIWAENNPEGGSAFHVLCTLETVAPCQLTLPENMPTPASLQAIEPRRVLLTEDNPVNQMVAATLLTKHGHQVTVANHGGEALAHLAGNTFDVILMDMHMPVMDGFETLRRLRADEKNNHLPPRRVIAVTANAMHDDRKMCLEAGFDGYLSKPFRVVELMAVLAASPVAEPA